MGYMPVGRLTVNMAWPAMLSMFIHSLYNIVDSIFVAKLGESALTAVTLAFPVQLLIISLAAGTGIGVNSFIARSLGAQRFDDADSAASHGFRLSFINWSIFALFAVFFAEIYIDAYTDTPEVLQQGALFLKIVAGLSLFSFIQINTEKVLQATGNMVGPMICSITGGLINIAGNPILIFGLFGFPEFGIAGSAIATVAGQFISMCMGLFLLFAHKHQVKVHLRNFKWSRNTIKGIYTVGFPSIVMQAISSVMLFSINAMLAAVSETAVAIVGVYFRLQSFIFLPVFGLSQGAMPIMGYNYGARNRSRLMQSFFFSLKVALTILGFGCAVFLIFPSQLLALFSASDNMMTLGGPALRTISLTFVPAAFGIMTSTFFQATGYGMLSFWQSLIRQLIGIIPLAWIYLHFWGVSAIWWAWPSAEILAFGYSVIFLKRVYKTDIKNL